MNENVFKYVNAPIMPGIRKIAGAPDEHYRLSVDLDAALEDNFVPSHGQGFYAGRHPGDIRFPIMGAGGMGIEGFGTFPNYFWRIVIFLLIVGLVIYLLQQKE